MAREALSALLALSKNGFQLCVCSGNSTAANSSLLTKEDKRDLDRLFLRRLKNSSQRRTKKIWKRRAWKSEKETSTDVFNLQWRLATVRVALVNCNLRRNVTLHRRM